MFVRVLTVVIFRYVAPADAQWLEVAFSKFHAVSSLTIVIFPYVAPAGAQVLQVAFEKIHVFRVSLSLYFLL